jgi:hypothetical protein
VYCGARLAERESCREREREREREWYDDDPFIVLTETKFTY